MVFHVSMEGCFSDGGGGFIFKWGACPMGGGVSVLMGAFSKKL